MKFMHPDVVAILAKTQGRGHLCTLDACLISSEERILQCTIRLGKSCLIGLPWVLFTTLMSIFVLTPFHVDVWGKILELGVY